MHLGSDNLYENRITFAKFTKTQAFFVCGLQNGLTFYLTNTLKRKAHINVDGEINHMELMGNENIIAVVGRGSNPTFQPNQVNLVDIKTNKIEPYLQFDSDIKGIIKSSQKFVVLLESSIKVYKFSLTPPEKPYWESEMNSNPKGLCAFRVGKNISLLAFPDPDAGSLKIINLKDKMNPTEVKAHVSPLACIAMNLQATRIATASERGTLIRIFDAFTGELVNELRRGSSQANILCINFNSDSSMLCVSSDHGTIHVFYLTENIEKDEKNSYFGSSISGYVPGFVSGIASVASSAFLPTYINSTWSSYKFEVPNKVPCICGFTTENKIAAICGNGKVYVFSHTSKEENPWEVGTNYLEINGNMKISKIPRKNKGQQKNSMTSQKMDVEDKKLLTSKVEGQPKNSMACPKLDVEDKKLLTPKEKDQQKNSMTCTKLDAEDKMLLPPKEKGQQKNSMTCPKLDAEDKMLLPSKQNGQPKNSMACPKMDVEDTKLLTPKEKGQQKNSMTCSKINVEDKKVLPPKQNGQPKNSMTCPKMDVKDKKLLTPKVESQLKNSTTCSKMEVEDKKLLPSKVEGQLKNSTMEVEDKKLLPPKEKSQPKNSKTCPKMEIEENNVIHAKIGRQNYVAPQKLETKQNDSTPPEIVVITSETRNVM